MPAYGRIYATQDAVMRDWNKNIDFKIVDGPYLNKKDWEKYGSRLDSLMYSWRGLTFHIQVGMI